MFEHLYRTYEASWLKAAEEVRMLNKAVKNKHKLKTALRAANKKLDELEQERFNMLHETLESYGAPG